METLLCLSVALLAGLFMTRVIKPLKLPAVTAYLVAGILIGPYVLGRLQLEGVGFVTHEQVLSFKPVCDVALGFIAFSIGNEFRLGQLKKIGRQAVAIAIFQALAATALVDVSLIGLHFILGGDVLPIEVAIVLGAIATATAPAATLMVVKQYKAKGPLTDMLLPVVALDDAVGLVVFAVSFGVARAIESGSAGLASILLEPLIEVTLSLALGALLGYLLTHSEKCFHSRSKRLCISLAYVVLATALSMVHFEIGSVKVGFSSLLVFMMLGTVFCNICDFSEDMMEQADRWATPLLALFFVLSGAELELSVFANPVIVGIGIVYILTRSIGKIAGAAVSARATGCDAGIVKYLGITLLPQAGVSLGMSLTAAQQMGAGGIVIRNITLFAVLVYELVGPMMTKMALMRAGEIDERPEPVKRPNVGRNPHRS